MPSPQLGWSHCVKLRALTNHSEIRGLSEQLHTHTLEHEHTRTYPHNNATYLGIFPPSTHPVSSSIAAFVILWIHLSSFLWISNCLPSVSQHQQLPFALVFLFIGNSSAVPRHSSLFGIYIALEHFYIFRWWIVLGNRKVRRERVSATEVAGLDLNPYLKLFLFCVFFWIIHK